MADVDRSDEENETELAGSRSLRGAVFGSWLGTALAVAVCAATFHPWYPGYASLAVTALVLVVSALLVARRAATKEGAWGIVLAAVASAGAIPSFVVVSLYGATRPLMACRGVVGKDCFPTEGTILAVGAGTLLVPLLATGIAAVVIAKRRRRSIARILPGLATVGLVVAILVVAQAGWQALRFVAADRYLDTVPEIGTLSGPTFVLARDNPDPEFLSFDDVTTSWGTPGSKVKWSYRPHGLPCTLAIGGGSYEVAAAETRQTGRGEEIVCSSVRVRQDTSRSLLVIDEKLPDGGYRPAFSVRSEGYDSATSGPLYVNSSDLPRVSPARPLVITGLAGVLAALALIAARLGVERRLVGRWRKAPVGRHRGDGWVAFDDDASPPRHLSGASQLPLGEVRVLGLGETVSGGYRTESASADGAVAGVLADVERDSRERCAAALVLSGLIAFIAATPVASVLFVMRV